MLFLVAGLISPGLIGTVRGIAIIPIEIAEFVQQGRLPMNQQKQILDRLQQAQGSILNRIGLDKTGQLVMHLLDPRTKQVTELVLSKAS
jgi:hypothetical protein